MKKINQDQLLNAYYKTDYTVYEPNIIIKIGEKNSELDKLLKSENVSEWVYITAYNPMSEEKTENQNEISNKILLNDIQGYKVFNEEGKGEDKSWKPEKSFLILGINKEKATELGRKYIQKAIVFGVIEQPAELIILF